MDQDMLALAKRVLRKLIITRKGDCENDHLTLETWEWPQGVAIYAMLRLWQATGDLDSLDTARSWYERQLAKGIPPRNVNTTAPMLGMTILYEESHSALYRDLIKQWADWVMHDMPRTREGGLQHITTHDVNEQQLWDDTLFMTVLFLYRAGCALERPDWQEEALYQFLLHIKYLHSPQTGLWYHGYSFLERGHFAGAFWARGNSWFTASAVELLEMLDKDDAVRRIVAETLREQCAALRDLQDADTGLWHTLLDRADSYVETSASAAIAYGLLKGIRLGILDKGFQSCADRACEGVCSQIAKDGTVNGVSYGTPMGRTIDFYRDIPIKPTAYGQGLVFLMLTEMLRESHRNPKLPCFA